jgi:hypothetical protein
MIIGKLGKKPAKIDPRTLKLAHYLGPDLPPPPPAVNYVEDVTFFGEMLNGELGDCTIAACGHAEQAWSIGANGPAGMYTPPDSLILQKYEQWCGYVPGDPSTDNGGVEIDVLNKWRKYHLHKPIHRHPLAGYADPSTTNIEEIKQAIYLFGGVYIGIQLPLSVQGLDVWDVSSGNAAIPGSWGGHAVFVPKYATNPDGTITFTCISWGELIEITQAFWLYSDHVNGPYIDEVHCLVSTEFLNLKTGTTPEGLNIAQMLIDVQAVSS